jgi:hypothetical protein
LARSRRRLLVVATLITTLVYALAARFQSNRLEEFEQLSTLLDAFDDDDPEKLDAALADVFPLWQQFLPGWLWLVDVAGDTSTRAGQMLLVEQTLQSDAFDREHGDYCLELVQSMRAASRASALQIPLAWLEMRVRLRLYALDDDDGVEADPLRKLNCVLAFLEQAQPLAEDVVANPLLLRDRTRLALLVADLIVGHEAFAESRWRLGHDVYYDLLVRLDGELAAARSKQRKQFVRILQLRVADVLACVHANFGQFSAVANLNKPFDPIVGNLSLARDLASHRGLAGVPPPRVVSSLSGRGSAERLSMLAMLCLQERAGAGAGGEQLVFHDTQRLAHLIATSHNVQLVLLSATPRQTIAQLRAALEQMRRQLHSGELRFTSQTAAQLTPAIDLDDFLRHASDDVAAADTSALVQSFCRPLPIAPASAAHTLAAAPAAALASLDSHIDLHLANLAALDELCATDVHLSFVRGKFWHEYQCAPVAQRWYEHALAQLEHDSADYIVIDSYRRRAAQAAAALAGTRDDAPLIDHASTDDAGRTLMALARVAAANGVGMTRHAGDWDPLRRDVTDAVRCADVARTYRLLSERWAGVAAPPPRLRLKHLSLDDLGGALATTWTTYELGCDEATYRRHRLQTTTTPFQVAIDDVDWRWLRHETKTIFEQTSTLASESKPSERA